VKKPSFWSFNVGHLLTIITWVATVFVLYGKLSKTIESHENQLLEVRRAQTEILVTRLPDLSEKIARIDANIEWMKNTINKRAVAASVSRDIGLTLSKTPINYE
jgi:hypothetical protein